VITSTLSSKPAPESRETIPVFGSPAFMDGFEWDAQRMTLLGVDFGSTSSPSVKRLPRVVMTWLSITALPPSSVRAWIFPKSSET
jgi:hypothetical protein